jgi:hypothetical protein
MKNSEEAIEKVLADLRNADAPEGMERRILDAMEDQALRKSRSVWSRLRPMWLAMPDRPAVTMSFACGIALGVVVGVAIAIPAIRRIGHTDAESKVNPVRAGSLAPVSSKAEVSGTQVVPYEHRASSIRSVGRLNADTRRPIAESDADSVARQEMLAVSYPAPPMPLTAQERLLLRIAHRHDPVELAMLEPELRAVEEAKEKEEFQRFFGPPANKSTAEQLEPATSTPEQAGSGQPNTEQETPGQLTTEQPKPEQPATGDKE